MTQTTNDGTKHCKINIKIRLFFYFLYGAQVTETLVLWNNNSCNRDL